MDPEVQIHPVAADADAILREQVAALLDVDPATVQVGRLCPRCGSSAHGRPRARAAGRREQVGVSISRSGPHLVTAAGRHAHLGVDIEQIAAVAAGWDGALVLHPSEHGEDRDPAAQAALWCRKEAILKADGRGLAVPMATLRAADHPVRDLPAPEGYRLALAAW